MAQKTINLQEMLTYALHYLSRNPNPRMDYLPYFGGKIPEDGPPRLERCYWDYGDGTGRFLESSQLTKRALGHGIASEVEKGLWKNLFSGIASDGLFYSPETPWSSGDYADVWYQRGFLAAMLLRYEEAPEAQDLKVITRMIDVLDELAIRENGETFFYYSWNRNRQWNRDESLSPVFALIDILTLCAEVTGNTKALSLAGDLVQSMLDGKYRYFDDEGSVCYPISQEELADFKGQNVDFTLVDGKPVIESKSAWLLNNGHATSRSTSLLGLVRYSIFTGDRKLLERSKIIYDKFTSDYCTSFGWAPENLLTAGRECSEMCTTADLLISQILLAKAGYYEYWEHTEKYLRNHITQSQFFPNEVVEEIAQRYDSAIPESLDNDHMSYENVLNRLAGGFAGPIYPDDLFCFYPKSRKNPQGTRTIDISGCCSPSGIKAVAWALLNAVDFSGNSVKVNLLMDYKNDIIQMDSALPNKGEISVYVKKNVDLSVRAPLWCKRSEDIQCAINNSNKPVHISEGYVRFGRLASGSEVVMKFSLPQSNEEMIVGQIPYELSWRGYNVVSLKNLTDYQPLMPCYNKYSVQI